MMQPVINDVRLPAGSGIRKSARVMFAVTRREMRDHLRDWRIVLPIILLTLIFPALMNFTAARIVAFVEGYGAPIVAERLIPFLLMIVGFFPISVSLVIALESFVGEKERRSIEPLLCSPLSDAEIYLGKLIASTLPPLLASYLGIAVYLIGVYFQVGWKAPPGLLVQIVALTTVQAIVMVAGAVVVSSQTTSVRAANLLASFIIIPMAFLIQGESVVMFWAEYDVLWWAILGQVLIAGLLIRTGLAYFNREEMLGRELDVLDPRWVWRVFRRSFGGGQTTLFGWYRWRVLPSLAALRPAMLVVTIVLGIGAFVGVELAKRYVLPDEMLAFDTMAGGLIETMESLSLISPQGVTMIWVHNLRSLTIATALGVFSFGVLGMLVLMLPIAIIAFMAANTMATGLSAGAVLAGLVLPHGWIEIPAMIIAGAAILNLGATLTAPANGKSLGEAFIFATARWAIVMLGVALPMFFIAAILEIYVTPRAAVWLLGR